MTILWLALKHFVSIVDQLELLDYADFEIISLYYIHVTLLYLTQK